MKKLNFLSLVLVFIVVLTSCGKDDDLVSTSLLKTRWSESYEEKTSEEIDIFRTGDPGDFPPSWYRQVFYFDDNQVCEYSVLAPDDGHYMARGSWEHNEKTNVIKIYNSESKKLYEFRIVELTDEVLKLKEND